MFTTSFKEKNWKNNHKFFSRFLKNYQSSDEIAWPPSKSDKDPTEKIGVFDARILMRIDFDSEIKVFKHGIKKEENRLHRVTKRSDVLFAGILI